MQQLLKVSIFIDVLNTKIGQIISWLTLFMVLVQLAVVVLRYVFSIGSIPLQETIWYMHGVIFMVAAGAVYLSDDHVRIDVFYRDKSKLYRAWVDLIGITFLLLPLCFMTTWLSWGYVINSWKSLEGSIELSGLPIIFLYKTVIWVFTAVLGLQAISQAIKSILIIWGDETGETL